MYFYRPKNQSTLGQGYVSAPNVDKCITELLPSKADGQPSSVDRQARTYMKDRENNHSEGTQLPPAWCSGICRNAMNEICIEHCAPKHDCSGFEEKPNLKLTDMPRFPNTEGMTKEEKFKSVTIYLEKVVDHLQGHEDEYTIYLPVRRPNHERSPSSHIPANQQTESLLHSFSEADSPHLIEPKRDDQATRPDSLVETSD